MLIVSCAEDEKAYKKFIEMGNSLVRIVVVSSLLCVVSGFKVHSNELLLTGVLRQSLSRDE